MPGFPHDAADGGANEDGLVRQLLDLELRRERLLHAGKQGADTLDNAKRRRVAVFDNSFQEHPGAHPGERCWSAG